MFQTADIDTLAKKVVSLLRSTGALEGRPSLDSNASMTLDELFSSMKGILYEDAMEKALDTIPDSKEVVVIDVGSAYGIVGGGYLGSKKANITVHLIDRRIEDQYFPLCIFSSDQKHPHRLTFAGGVELILTEPNREERVNALYRMNEIENVHFHEMELTPDNLAEVPHMLELKSKKVYLFSLRSTITLPFLTARLAQILEPCYLLLSPTGQERIKREEFPWEVIARNLSLNDEETNGYCNSLFECGEEGTPSRRYDYKVKQQKDIATLLKLGISLALARGVSGSIMRNLWRRQNGLYGQPDYFIESST